jgi:hypothetical protein
MSDFNQFRNRLSAQQLEQQAILGSGGKIIYIAMLIHRIKKISPA